MKIVRLHDLVEEKKKSVWEKKRNVNIMVYFFSDYRDLPDGGTAESDGFFS